MANMTYCRFENTYNDLLDCQEVLANKPISELSESEKKYAMKLVYLCRAMEKFAQEDDDDLQLDNRNFVTNCIIIARNNEGIPIQRSEQWVNVKITLDNFLIVPKEYIENIDALIGRINELKRNT